MVGGEIQALTQTNKQTNKQTISYHRVQTSVALWERRNRGGTAPSGQVSSWAGRQRIGRGKGWKLAPSWRSKVKDMVEKGRGI